MCDPILPTQEPDDLIIRATAFDNAVRAFACRTTKLCREAVLIHGLSPAAAAAMGRLLSGVLMLSQDLDKPGDTITAVIQSDGPIQGMTVIGEYGATVRGSILQPVVETVYMARGKLDIGAVVGKGTLMVIRDQQLKEPYVGRIALVSGEIAEDLASYLAISEQIPSVVSLGVKMTRDGVSHAGGLMLQLLPDADDTVVKAIERQLETFPDMTTLLESGATPEEMLRLLTGPGGLDVHSKTPCAYACPCSRERMTRNLIAMGLEELNQLAGDPDGIELQCHFCGARYRFSQGEVRQLLAAIPAGDHP